MGTVLLMLLFATCCVIPLIQSMVKRMIAAVTGQFPLVTEPDSEALLPELVAEEGPMVEEELSPRGEEPLHEIQYGTGEGECFVVTVVQTGPNEYRDQQGNLVNARGGPLDCPFGNPLCEWGVRAGAGWECWDYHPQAARAVRDPQFWDAYARDLGYRSQGRGGRPARRRIKKLKSLCIECASNLSTVMTLYGT